MTEFSELFYRDPYARTFEAQVLRCTASGKGGFEVVLSDTAFYPEGGGQPEDHGTLDAAAVTDVKRVGGEIVHYTDKALAEGSTVRGTLDWDRRFDNMQNHTGEHVFSGIVHAKFGYENVGFHMDDDVITVDFDGPITEEELTELEKKTQEAIAANIPVNISFPDEAERASLQYRSKIELKGTVRIVDIPGADRCACCGTHVARTAEVGAFKILTSEKHRGGQRITFVCGGRAMRDYEARIRETQAVSVALSAKPLEVAAAVEKLQQQLAREAQHVRELTQSLYAFRAEALHADKVIVVEEPDTAPAQLRTFCTVIAEKHPEAAAVAVLSSTGTPEEPLFSYVIYSKAANLREISAALNKSLNGRGGGSGGFVQGSYRADRASIESAVRAAF